MLAEHQKQTWEVEREALDRRLNSVAGQRFHNRSTLDFEKLLGDPDNILQDLTS